MKAAGARAAADVLWSSARAQWAETRAVPMTLVVGVIFPAMLLIVALGGQVAPSATEGSRLASGVLLTSFWGNTVWSGAGILRRERSQGTLARALTGVRDPRLIVLGKSFAASVASALCVLATVTGTLMALSQPVALEQPGWMVLGLVLVIASGTALGVMIGGIFVLTRHGSQVSSALTYPVFLLGGLLIPPDLLPAWVRPVSSLLSLRWLQEFLSAGAEGSANLTAPAAALVLTVVYALGGARIFRRMVDRAREEGTIDFV